MNALTPPRALVDQLENESSESLRLIIKRSRAILSERDEQDKKAALDQIRRLAKEHGLNVAVKRPARKRGRPPKMQSEV